MNIIKRKKKHLWIECDHCGSILEPSEKDYEERTTIATDYESIRIINQKRYVLTVRKKTKWVDCPVCQHEIEIEASRKESYEQF